MKGNYVKECILVRKDVTIADVTHGILSNKALLTHPIVHLNELEVKYKKIKMNIYIQHNRELKIFTRIIKIK